MILCPKLLYFFEKMHKVFKNKVHGCCTPLTLLKCWQWHAQPVKKLTVSQLPKWKKNLNRMFFSAVKFVMGYEKNMSFLVTPNALKVQHQKVEKNGLGSITIQTAPQYTLRPSEAIGNTISGTWQHSTLILPCYEQKVANRKKNWI